MVTNKKKAAIILTGCGVNDGSEINEAVITMLELEKAGIDYQCYGFDQRKNTVNHFYKTKQLFKRNSMQEAARITRGNIKNIKSINKHYHSSMIVIGGYGICQIASNFEKKTIDFEINEDFYTAASIIRDQKTPALYMCIASILLPKIYKKPICTIGKNADFADIINKTGGIHEEKQYNEFSFDKHNRIISTPAFMEAANLNQLQEGIANSVNKLQKIL